MKKLVRILFVVLILAILFSTWSWFRGCSSAPAVPEDPLLQTNADQLKQTVITPHLETPLDTQTNVLWCGTFQLAWNQTATLTGGSIRFAPPQPEFAAPLNRETFTTADLDEPSYLVDAGSIRDGILARIPLRMAAKFPAASPALLPKPSPEQRPQDIVAYCYLQKTLQFATPFERRAEPMTFGNTPVACFGMSEEKEGKDAMAKQVRVLDARTRDEFVLELLTKSSPADRLILAKIPPQKTLADTLADVQRRIAAGKPTTLTSDDILAIPKLNFDLTRRYTELLGHPILSTAPGMPADFYFTEAVQNIRFRIDEKGVILRSESHSSLGCAEESAMPRSFIFNQPFLLLLQRQDRPTPYFALWIANPELLVPAKK